MAENMSIIIRNAVRADARGIGLVHYGAWIETYTGLLSEAYLSSRSAQKSAAMLDSAECKDIAVAEVGGKIVGFCGWGKFRDISDDSMGEIQGIYVLDAYKRRHIGQGLVEYALARLKADGYDKVGLWVLDKNENAIGFYEKMGFEHFGATKKAILGDTVTERLYIKILT